MPFINWTMFTPCKHHFTFTVFIANVVFCYANTTVMSDDVNECLLILIRQQLMFINLHLFGLSEHRQ